MNNLDKEIKKLGRRLDQHEKKQEGFEEAMRGVVAKLIKKRIIGAVDNKPPKGDED